MDMRCICRASILARKAAIFAIFLIPAVAYAQHGDSDPVANAYADMHQVSVAEAAYRLSKVQGAAKLEQQLQRDLPDTFAGLYIEHHPAFRIVVKFTDYAPENLARYTDDPLFVAQASPYPLELLRAAQDELGEKLMKSGIQFESGIDVKKSEVNVFVLDPAATLQHISGILSAVGFVKLNKTLGFMTPTAISGGVSSEA